MKMIKNEIVNVTLDEEDTIYVLTNDKLDIIPVILQTEHLRSNLLANDDLPKAICKINDHNFYLKTNNYHYASNVDYPKFPLYYVEPYSKGIGMAEDYGYNFFLSETYFYLNEDAAKKVRSYKKKHRQLEYKLGEIRRKAEEEAEKKAKETYDMVYKETYYKLLSDKF